MSGAGNEPSMEEILSSIKRIIAEDSDAALSPPKTRRTASVRPVADPVPDMAHEEEVLELTETVDTQAMPLREHLAAEAVKPELVSDAAVQASRSSLAALSALIVKPEVAGGDTLEGLVREMLKPMLAEWLEARLPEVVERLVAQEIQRITARG